MHSEVLDAREDSIIGRRDRALAGLLLLHAEQPDFPHALGGPLGQLEGLDPAGVHGLAREEHHHKGGVFVQLDGGAETGPRTVGDARLDARDPRLFYHLVRVLPSVGALVSVLLPILDHVVVLRAHHLAEAGVLHAERAQLGDVERSRAAIRIHKSVGTVEKRGAQIEQRAILIHVLQEAQHFRIFFELTFLNYECGLLTPHGLDRRHLVVVGHFLRHNGKGLGRRAVFLAGPRGALVGLFFFGPHQVSAKMLGESVGGVVSTGQHHAKHELLDGERVARKQVGRGARD